MRSVVSDLGPSDFSLLGYVRFDWSPDSPPEATFGTLLFSR